jgi:hypothetical protein
VFDTDAFSEWALYGLVFKKICIYMKKTPIIHSSAAEYPKPTSIIRERAELEVFRADVKKTIQQDELLKDNL